LERHSSSRDRSTKRFFALDVPGMRVLREPPET
jgi:hypothetical protein